jgi:isochorismate synthase
VDYIRYRFPGEEIAFFEGSFSQVKSFEGLQGFVLSDFNGNKKYHFRIGEKPEPFEGNHSLPCVLSKDEYLEQGGKFLDQLKTQKLEKAVFSRVKQVTSETQPENAFELLEKAYPSAFVYLIQSEELGTWIGASPEILAKYNTNRLSTVALAGTLPAHSNHDWSEKEIREQQAVVDFIQETARKFSEVIEIGERKEVLAGPVRHLKTEISFTLDSERFWELIAALHPTPAVSGLPVEKALELIRTYEAHDRKFYSGYLGRITDQETKLYVNLRCGEWIGEHFYLYLGGGYNESSIVEKEWEETENKSRTLLNILQKGSFDQ